MDRNKLGMPTTAAVAILFVAALNRVAAPNGSTSPVSDKGGPISGVAVVSDTATVETSSLSWVDVPGASAIVTIPFGWSTGLVLARFSAAASCSFSVGGTLCSARVVVGGVEANPAGGMGHAFTQASDEGAMAIDRSLGSLPPGRYVVSAQLAVTDPSALFVVSDWSLTV